MGFNILLMKIVLVFPNMGILTGEPPLGIGYISAYLRERGIKTKIIDTTFKPFFKFIEKNVKKADIVGIYASTVMINDSFKVAEIAKSYEVPLVVMGGPHPSVLPEETLKHKAVDAIVIGEGEYSFFKLVEKFEKRNEKKDLSGIPNVWVKVKGKIIKEKRRFFIKNLDEIPFPARDLFDMKKYIAHWFQLDVVSPNLKGTNVCLTRSCPFSCTFCQPTLRILFGPFRRRSPKNIIDEFIHLKEKFGINAVQSVDDLFFIDEKYIERFCKTMIEEGVDMIWGCQSRVDTIPSLKTLKLAYKAGLRMVSIGIESASERILKLYNKGITLNQVKTAVKKLKLVGIKVRGYFILGAPTETLKEIKETIKFATSLSLDEAAFSILTPFPKTYIYEFAKKEGWKIDENWNYDRYYKRGGFLKNVIPDKIIRKYQRLAFLMFYLHPRRFIYLFNSIKNPVRSLTKLRCYFV
ncbi:MAG: hypothetical protein DRP15_02775 [Candidatus Aenigmatarchaeota archaeon]|nr:MAG: hypothetical protein DRP15_02775 [Candidatus Aenigmarchaeota archaeon]